MNGKCSKIPTTLPLSACSADIPLSEGDKGATVLNLKLTTLSERENSIWSI